MILVFVILGCSLVVLVTIGQNILGYRNSLSQSRSAYGNGDYFSAYEDLVGVNLKKDDETLFKKARLLADLQKRNQEYNVFMNKKMYAMALDTLLIGANRYQENLDEAKKLDIEKEYTSLGEPLIQLLSDQFGVSIDEALEIYQLNREDYSIRVDEIIKEAKLD